MEHYVILHNQVPRYVHRDLCYTAMAKYVALHNATYLAIATVFGPKNQELLMEDACWNRNVRIRGNTICGWVLLILTRNPLLDQKHKSLVFESPVFCGFLAIFGTVEAGAIKKKLCH